MRVSPCLWCVTCDSSLAADPNLHTVKVVIYVVSGVVAAAIFIFLMLFIIQRLLNCGRLQDYIDDHNAVSRAPDRSVSANAATPQPSVIYKPSVSHAPSRHALLPGNASRGAAAAAPTQAPPPDEHRAMLPDAQPPSYEEVLRLDAKLWWSLHVLSVWHSLLRV